MREALLARGRELRWHPPYMRARLRDWVEGLNGDWLRQPAAVLRRAVPGLVSRSTPTASRATTQPIVPDEADAADRPVDRRARRAYDRRSAASPGGFIGDPDVMDTWATSSLTPQIAAGWEDDPDLFARTFPMDLRPQAHEIIRTWLFYTVLRSHLEHDTLPVDERGDQRLGARSRPQEDVEVARATSSTPTELFEQHGADAVRYWAASARLGFDAAIDEQQMKVGRRLAIKLLNASKFVLELSTATPGAIAAPVDRSMLAASSRRRATRRRPRSTDYEHARALERIERFFWGFSTTTSSW